MTEILNITREKTGLIMPQIYLDQNQTECNCYIINTHIYFSKKKTCRIETLYKDSSSILNNTPDM